MREQQMSDSVRYVSVTLERSQRTHKQWSYVEWKAIGVVPAQPADDKYRTLIHSEPGCERYLCGPFPVELYKDGSESYWNNLMAAQPSLFVVCRQDETDGDMNPFIVTFNYDEIIGYMEVDDHVFSFPIPDDLYVWVEKFVVDHYQPHTPKKRKRKNWSQEDEHGAPPAQRQH